MNTYLVRTGTWKDHHRWPTNMYKYANICLIVGFFASHSLQWGFQRWWIIASNICGASRGNYYNFTTIKGKFMNTRLADINFVFLEHNIMSAMPI